MFKELLEGKLGFKGVSMEVCKASGRICWAKNQTPPKTAKTKKKTLKTTKNTKNHQTTTQKPTKKELQKKQKTINLWQRSCFQRGAPWSFCSMNDEELSLKEDDAGWGSSPSLGVQRGNLIFFPFYFFCVCFFF